MMVLQSEIPHIILGPAQVNAELEMLLFCNLVAELSTSLLQGQSWFDMVLRSVLSLELFPKVKFIKEINLMFSTELN